MAAAAGRIVAGSSATVPQILTNAQGQILAIGTPQVGYLTLFYWILYVSLLAMIMHFCLYKLF